MTDYRDFNERAKTGDPVDDPGHDVDPPRESDFVDEPQPKGGEPHLQDVEALRNTLKGWTEKLDSGDWHPDVIREGVRKEIDDQLVRDRGGPYDVLPTLRELEGSEDWLDGLAPAIQCLFSRVDEETREENGKPNSWIGAVPRGQVMMLAAPGACGKTFAAIGAGIAVATGCDWMGKFKVNHPGVAVGLFGETSRKILRNRIHAVAASMKLTPEQKNSLRQRFVALPLAGNARRFIDGETPKASPTQTADFRLLLKKLADIPDLRLVIVDTLARFGSPDAEVSQSGATATTVALEAIAALPSEPVVMVLHHTSQASRQAGERGEKPTAASVRGVTALPDNMRVTWVLSRTEKSPDHVFISCVKANDVESPEFTAVVKRGPGGALFRMTKAEADEAFKKRDADSGSSDDDENDGKSGTGKKGGKTNGSAKSGNANGDFERFRS